MCETKVSGRQRGQRAGWWFLGAKKCGGRGMERRGGDVGIVKPSRELMREMRG